MADDDQPALVVLEELAKPHHAVRVEVVRRLVEDHRLGVREEDARELDATALTAGERLQLLVEDAVGKRQVVRDRRRLGLGRVPAERLEPLGEVRVLAHRAGRDIRIVIAHGERCLVHAEREGAETARIEDAGAREHLGIAGARILRQVSELAGALHLAVGGQEIAGEHPGEGRLAGAVAADESDLVAVRHAERHVRHEDAGAHADFEVVDGEHGECPFDRWRGSSGPMGQPPSIGRRPPRLPVSTRRHGCGSLTQKAAIHYWTSSKFAARPAPRLSRMSAIAAPSHRRVLADVIARPSSRARAFALDAGLVIAGAAVVAVLAQVSIPLWPVPITGQTLGVIVVGAALGSRRGAAALITYMLVGLAGLPVFADFTGTIAAVAKPSFGFVIGFIFSAFVAGWFAERAWDRRPAPGVPRLRRSEHRPVRLRHPLHGLHPERGPGRWTIRSWVSSRSDSSRSSSAGSSRPALRPSSSPAHGPSSARSTPARNERMPRPRHPDARAPAPAAGAFVIFGHAWIRPVRRS